MTKANTHKSHTAKMTNDLIYNPSTNRCVKKDSPRAQHIQCDSEKVVICYEGVDRRSMKEAAETVFEVACATIHHRPQGYRVLKVTPMYKKLVCMMEFQSYSSRTIFKCTIEYWLEKQPDGTVKIDEIFPPTQQLIT